jgi:serine/threonine protein kinase
MSNDCVPAPPGAKTTAESVAPGPEAANTGIPGPLSCTSATSPSAPAGGQRHSAPSLRGKTLGDFELFEEMGRGGMGIVYKARQTSLDRLVAVKMLPTDQFPDPVRLQRFLAEARAAASLNHPNIVQVYQVGECSAGHFFAMEFIDGQSLEAWIKEGKLTVAASVTLLITVAEAVHYAHTKGVIHRDLKPANIMVDPFHRPVVMDFGIAKVLGKSSSLTQRGVIMGTPAYMSPEQAGEDLARIGPLSDVHSLGAILYTMLTGRLPYDGGSAFRTILKVLEPDMPTPVRQLRPHVPRELERICTKCMSKQPGDRYPTAQALAEDLRRFRTAQAQKKALVADALTPSVVLVAETTGKQVRLSKPRTVIGRASECGLILRAADVSKQHCQILLEDNQVIVEDLGSANGTFVNDRPVQRARLRDGDQLRIVRYGFQVRLPRAK